MDEDVDGIRPFEGLAMQEEEHSDRADNREAINTGWHESRQARRRAGAIAVIALLVVSLYGFAFGLVRIARRYEWSRNWQGDLGFAGLAAAGFLGLLFAIPQMFGQRADAPLVEMAAALGLEAPGEATEDGGFWDGVRTGGEEGFAIVAGIDDFDHEEELLDELKLDDEPMPVEEIEVEEIVENPDAEDADAFFLEREKNVEFRYKSRPLAPREYAHRHHGAAIRTDFTETVYWNALIVTGEDGHATITFDTSDRITTWDAEVSAHGAGRVGQGRGTFDTRLPFYLDVSLPNEVTAGDRVGIPIAFTVEDPRFDEAELKISATGSLTSEESSRQSTPLADGRGRIVFPVLVGDAGDVATRIQVLGAVGRFRDVVRKPLRVVPRGYPHRRSWAGAVGGEPTAFVVPMPGEVAPGSERLILRVFPSPLATLRQGLQGILQEPHGCFEQASSSNYPNTLVLSYVEASGDNIPSLVAEASALLPKGYAKITGYECGKRGYEWWGSDPGHEALTAYGLMQFQDMAAVYDVDSEMVARTREWLLARRDGNGGFQRNPDALDAFGSAPQPVTDAYSTYALLYSGAAPDELSQEVARLARRAVEADDAYELAIVACALGVAKHDGAAAARERLVTMQKDDGSLCGSTTSITHSGERDLTVETTSFAILAWLDGGDAQAGRVHAACEFLQTRQDARGTFGATQATVMALKALTATARANRRMPASGHVDIFVGDRRVATRRFSSDQGDAIEFDLTAALATGEQEVRIALRDVDGELAPLPWACDLEYHSDTPADDPEAKVGITTRLRSAEVEEGATVAVDVTVRNLTADGQPMAIANIGLPASLEVPTEVLDALRDARKFDFWEIRGRTVSLYWRSLAPEARQDVTIDCIARIPGTTTGPASNAYLYYTPTSRRWAPGVELVTK